MLHKLFSLLVPLSGTLQQAISQSRQDDGLHLTRANTAIGSLSLKTQTLIVDILSDILRS